MAPKKKVKSDASAAVWQVMGDDNTWTAFPDVDSAAIESKFRSGISGFVTSDLSFNQGFNSQYTFDFKKMTQTNADSGKARDISRLAPANEFEWEWQDDMGKFVGFYDDDCALIEGLWRKQGLNKPAETKALSFNKQFGSVYVFDFVSHDGSSAAVTGTQLNKDSGKKRPIRRLRKKQPWDTASYGLTAAEAAKKAEEVKAVVQTAATTPSPAPASPAAAGADSASAQGSLDPPVNWVSPVPLVSAQLGDFSEVPVASTSLEYADLKATFEASGGGATVVGIRRVQNTLLWSFYALRRKAMAVQNGGNLADASERLLYFGVASAPNLKLVCRHGFDVRIADENAIFGQGLYFARKVVDAGKSLAKAGGTREVVVARVACGRYAVGSKLIRRPPPLDPKQPAMALYDSCVDTVASPSVHIIFNNFQAYPEYIIEYAPTS